MPHFWEKAKFYGPLWDWEWRQDSCKNTEILQYFLYAKIQKCFSLNAVNMFLIIILFLRGKGVIMNVLLFHLQCFYSFLWGFFYAASLLKRHSGLRFPVGGNSNKGRHASMSGILLSMKERRNMDNELVSQSSSKSTCLLFPYTIF